MNTIESKFKVGEHIGGIVAHVFETMLTLQALPTPAAKLPHDRVSGAIGIAGDHVIGTVYLHFPDPLAREVTRAMLQSPPDQAASDSDVNDVIGEMSNMIGCRLKSLLNDADIFCAVSTPSVIRGAFAVEAPQGVRAEVFYFNCLGQRLAVEVHLQISDATGSSI
jgi:CheY-specific phosphatase CheX